MFQTEQNISSPQVKDGFFKTFYKNFSSQSHQPFFFNGVLFLALFIFIIFLVYSQSINLSVSLNVFHVYALIYVVFIQFFLGFLFVVFPRFLMQAEITKDVYMSQYKLYFSASVLFFISIFVSQYMTIASAVFLFCIQISSFKILYDIHKSSIMKEKNDTKWVLIAFLTGLIAHLFFIVSLFDFPNALVLQNATLYSGFYLFLFTLIFTISQRMVPFFTSMKAQGYTINKSKYLMEMVFSLLILKVVLLTFQKPELNFIADIPLLIVFVRELIKWKLPITKVVPIMWVLYVSIYWIPIGFLLSSVESLSYLLGYATVFEKSVIHIFAIGYFITILLGFGTRVVLGHSGRTPTADKITTAMFLLVQLAVLVRLIASFSINFEMNYMFWINVSALFLLVILLAWAVKYIPILINLNK